MALEQVVHDFTRKMNDNTEVLSLISGWERNIHIETVDTSEKFCVTVDGKTAICRTELMEPRHILLLGENAGLQDIFMGIKSPIKEYSAGRLRFKGGIKDEMMLDSIVRILWG